MRASDPLHSVDPLEAKPNDPDLSVFVLKEFVFCPRAGICAYEQQGTIEDPEEISTGRYIPIHDERELRLALKAACQQIGHILLSGFAAVILLIVMALLVGRLIFGLLSLGVAVLTLAVAYRIGLKALTIWGNLQIWKQADSQLPDLESPDIQYDIHWCRLIRGFYLHPTTRHVPTSPVAFGRKAVGAAGKGELADSRFHALAAVEDDLSAALGADGGLLPADYALRRFSESLRRNPPAG